ncbi:MAG: MBL fold metallo-hydrolase [Porphyromonas sp.]|nr:MBL fold metallo-hydrolase [Porphyromonas sp.]
MAGENTYLLYNEQGDAALIDCGASNREEWNMICAFLSDNNLTLKASLATHFHFDHVWGAPFILSTFGVKTSVPKKERIALPSLKDQLMAFGLSLDANIDDSCFQDLDENMQELIGTKVQILFVPGHSPGHLAFFMPEQKCVFSGDVIFAGGIGRTDLWGGSYQTLEKSILDCIYTLPPETTIYSGHGPSTSVKVEQQTNPFFRL